MRRCEHGSTEVNCPQCIARHLGIKHEPKEKQTFDIPKFLSNEGLREMVKELQSKVKQLQAELASVTAGKVTIVKEKFYPADKELIEQLQAENARLREAFDLTIDRSFWLLEKGSPAQWITHSEDYLKLMRQLAVDAPYIKSFEERSGIGMDKAWAFTGDSGKAIKFNSKEKAERFAKEKMLLEYGVVALEHMFMEMPATDEEKLNYIAKALASTDSSNWLAEQKAQWLRELAPSEELAQRFHNRIERGEYHITKMTFGELWRAINGCD